MDEDVKLQVMNEHEMRQSRLVARTIMTVALGVALIAGIHNLWGESIRAQRAHDEAQKAMWDQDALIGRLEQQLREQRVDMSDILNLRWSLT